MRQVHQAPKLAQPACTGRAQAGRVWPCRGQPSAVLQAPTGRVAAPRERPCAPCCQLACAPSSPSPARAARLRPTPPARPCRAPSLTVSWAWLHTVSQYNAQPCLLQYKTFIAIQCNPCNTIFPYAAIQSSHLLQYTFTSLAASKSQYNTLYCNTIWAVAQPTFAPHFFFVFHYLFIYFSILFPAIGNTQKHIRPFFFSSSTPNNFIKIYFLHFL